MRRARVTAIWLVLAITGGGAQAPSAGPPPPGAGQPAGQQPQAVFKSSTRLVIQNVYVKDREGRPIQGLTAKDFVVFEDNQRQEVAFVEYQRIANEPIVDTPEPAPASAAAAGVQRVANVEIAAPPPGN